MSFDAANRGAGPPRSRADGGVGRAASGRQGAAGLEDLRAALGDGPFAQIGRASCRERVFPVV